MKMRIFIAAATAGLMFGITGCTQTKLPGGVSRTSFLQRMEVSEVTVSMIGSNTTVRLKGYRNDGGNEAIATAVTAAVQAAVKSAVPVP